MRISDWSSDVCSSDLIGVFEARANPVGALPKDDLSVRAARVIQQYGPQYERLATNVFVPTDDKLGMGRLLQAFQLVRAAQPVYDRLVHAQRSTQLPPGPPPTAIADAAVPADLLTVI